MRKLYLYLASRSKRGIKIITCINGDAIVTSRITDLNRFDLPEVWREKISKIINDNKMLYEPWIESANSYNELKSRLKNRGYSNLPIGSNPMIYLEKNNHKANTSSCHAVKTMTRRKFS